MPSTNFVSNGVLNFLLNGSLSLYTSTLYVGLFKADPTAAGILTSEVSGNGYTRRSIDFTDSTAKTSSNSAVVTFPVATGNWGTITYLGLLTAQSGGSMLFYTPLSAARIVNINQVLKIKANAITITSA